jgi:hypothetical protein
VAIQSPTTPGLSDASQRRPAHLTWFDLILVAALSLGAFGIGGYVAAQVGFLAGPAVGEPQAFAVAAGVPNQANNVASLSAILGALHARIGTEYASGVTGQGTGTTKLLATLESDANRVALQQARAQVSLASANDRAQTARSEALTHRRWKVTALRALMSLACFAVLALFACAAAWWAAIRITFLPVMLGALILLIAFMVADIATWVAGVVFVILIVVLLLRDRTARSQGA